MSILSVSNLHFSYTKGQPILKGLNLNVPENSIYGFLGSNGAGKSTTIRNLLGLLTPQSGEITLFGKTNPHKDRSCYRQVGSLIEAPSLYPNLSAHDHLRLACRYQQVSSDQIMPVLKKVGLWEHRHKASKKYSTGMKQRLGLAIALLHEPKLLILDEPTNGLDPQGISDIRDLIKLLCEEGKTILLSSHLLSEIEKTVTHLGILKDGQLVFEGNQAALEEWKAKHLKLAIRTNDQDRANALLTSAYKVQSAKDYLHLQLSAEYDIPVIVRQLVTEGLDIYEAKLVRSDLEGLFMELNKDTTDHGQ
ncbi:MAG: ABC transporter ATP-binding protein [Lewinella sp.]|jgi:ABC-2 type transport system ATP-binding protein|uniref:ABC transporter ATP-binding protein n=1 Tax=Lewinella sp. TaxID=2004506 RepID=UPI003D6B13F3